MQKRKLGGFWCGFGVACGLWLLLLGILYYNLTTQGVTVGIAADEIAAIVEQNVKTEAEARLPALLRNARNELKDKIEQIIEAELNDLSLKIADLRFSLPASLQALLKKELREITEHGLNFTLNEVNTDAIADALGRDAKQYVKQELQRQLNGKVFVIYPYAWLEVPVKLVIK